MLVFEYSPCPCGSGKKFIQCCQAKPKQSFIAYSNPSYSVDYDTDGVRKGFVVNRKGAVVFLDESEQPVLDLQEGSSIKHVLSVGFTKTFKPIATIQTSGGPICYILPESLSDWCQHCVKQAQLGMNLFPEDVMFTKRDDKYFADFKQ